MGPNDELAESWKKGAIHVIGCIEHKLAAISTKVSGTVVDAGELCECISEAMRLIRNDIESLDS